MCDGIFGVWGPLAFDRLAARVGEGHPLTTQALSLGKTSQLTFYLCNYETKLWWHETQPASFVKFLWPLLILLLGNIRLDPFGWLFAAKSRHALLTSHHRLLPQCLHSVSKTICRQAPQKKLRRMFTTGIMSLLLPNNSCTSPSASLA